MCLIDYNPVAASFLFFFVCFVVVFLCCWELLVRLPLPHPCAAPSAVVLFTAVSCSVTSSPGNVVTGSTDAAVSLVETSRVLVTNNVFTDNKWGARYTVGASDNQASHLSRVLCRVVYCLFYVARARACVRLFRPTD